MSSDEEERCAKIREEQGMHMQREWNEMKGEDGTDKALSMLCHPSQAAG